MTTDTASPRGGAFSRARLAFQRWRRSRPFWGGFFLLLSGFLIFYSGNLDLGNLQIHMGLPGFQSYIIPLVLALCALLTWFTPDQRIFYGVIGLLAAIYSLIGANLGGFVVGFLSGTIGGGLAASWVPQKRREKPDAGATAEPDAEAQESQGLDVIDSDDDDQTPAGGGTPLHDTLPTSTQSPLVVAQSRHAAPDDTEPGAEGGSEAASERSGEGKQGVSFPHSQHAAGDSDVTGEAQRSITRVRWSPRAAVAIIAAVAVSAIGIVTFQAPSEAAPQTCASKTLTDLLKKAQTNKIATTPSGLKRKVATSTQHQTSNQSGFAGLASAPIGSRPLHPLMDAMAGLIDPSASSSPDPAPSAAPTTTPTSSPTATPIPTANPTPSPTPSSPPATTTSKPTSTATVTPKPSGSTAAPSPSVICVTTKTLTASTSQPIINDYPSTMTTAMLSMSGLSFDGVVDLPTHSGSMKVLQFSMGSSTSTPFELRPVSSNGNIDIKSSQLTVSSNVKFYCTEMKGLLYGVVPVDFTVASPPVLTVPDVYFTDVTIQLAFVYADSLSAAGLAITVS